MIILIGGEKGGTGKTTIATNLVAMKAIKNNGNVLLIDADKQGTASFWCGMRDEDNIKPRIPSIQKFGSNIRNEIKELSTKYADLIIDVGGYDSKELRAGLLVSDIAIFPIRPSQFDLWTLTKLNNLIDEAQINNPNLKGYMLVNAASTHPSVNERDEVLEYMEDMEHLSLLKSTIKERKVFRRCAMTGMCATEYPQQDNKATSEMENFYKEICE
tara:strand:- start:1366 stop:2010 length:645 start_codon:yes stop_codon:yes gene_type:complete